LSSGSVSRDSWDRWLLLIGMGLNSLPLGYDLVVLPIYLNEIGYLGEIIGAITSVSSIASTVALVPFAVAADRLGRKRFVFWGFVTSAIAFVIFGTRTDLASLLVASAIGGVGLAGGFTSAVWVPAWTALLAEKAPDHHRTKAFAWSQGVWTIALTLGSAMSIFPATFRSVFHMPLVASFQTTFLILAAICVLSGLILVPVKESHKRPDQRGEASLRRLIPQESLRQTLRFSFTFSAVGLASGFAVQLLSLWFNKMYDVNESVLGPWFAAAEVTSLVVVPLVPRLTHRLGSALSVLSTQAGSAALLAVMVLAPTYQAAGTIYIARNFLMNISWPIQQSYLMGTVSAHERASASAISYMAWGVGSSVGPFIAGYMLGRQSYLWLSAPIVTGAVLYLAAAVGFFLFFRKVPPPEEANK